MPPEQDPTRKPAPDWRGLPDFEKYDRLVEEMPDGWWDLRSPLGGLHALNRARVAYFRDKLGGFAGKRILDVGCGGGIFAESLADDDARVVGIDPSSASIRVAREHAASQNLPIDYRIGFAERLGFEREFDAVFAVDVLEHVEDLTATLAACSRALKPGGFFGFLTHNQTLEAFRFLIWEQEYVERSMPKGAHDFHKFLTPEALSSALRGAGLNLLEVRGLSRAGRGESYEISLSEDLSISYLGLALRAEPSEGTG
ncbi:MAG TPA: bifunctional 2-polyprenyl-6-hydroxyphenol methylase/3-demethylubiquinol 3-O-methyltransferase UbiG [Candidatus Polarisedimenticolia bacterium]|nr:bifunctional 2-polyprenyl-6-hydroxyphenol methylase/3-demethylubiquinol 3-O-methyltransferase UbiG [Candidatus Polarisedimenticolia bacterium]